jgi:hypothetical protein
MTGKLGEIEKLDFAIALFSEGGYALYANDDAMLGTRNAACRQATYIGRKHRVRVSQSNRL